MDTKGQINFYQVFPIYREELEYAKLHGAESLEKLILGDYKKPIIDVSRKIFCINKKIEKEIDEIERDI